MATKIAGYDINQDWKIGYNPQMGWGGTGNPDMVFFNSKDPTQKFYGTKNDANSLYEAISGAGGKDIELTDTDMLGKYFSDPVGIFKNQQTAKIPVISPTNTGSNTGSSAGASGLTLEMQRTMTPQQRQDYYAKIEGQNSTGGTKTSTGGTQTGGVSSETKPPKYAPFTITSNLKYGSRGQEVEDLQKYLASIQLYNGKIDGIFGNITLDAVKKFQQSQGLTADGVVGPKTTSAINAFQGGKSIPDNTKAGYTPPNAPSNQYNTDTGQPNSNYQTPKDPETKALEDAMAQNPALKALYNQQAAIIDEMKKQGQVVNPDLTISPALLKQFQDEVAGKLDPYYQELARQEKENLGITFDQLQQDYEKNVQREQPQFQQNLENLDQTEANQGTAFSSGRNLREGQLITNENQRLGDLATNAQRSLQDTAIGAERKLGSRDFSSLGIPSLQNYATQSRTIAPQGQFASTGGRQLFNPIGNLEGSLPIEKRTTYGTEVANLSEQERKKRILDAGGLGNTVYG